MFLFSATPPKNIVKDVPSEKTTRKNTKVIVMVLVLLAILILLTLIAFYVMYVRRRNFKKQGNSPNTIQLFTIKLISNFSHTKLKSQKLLVILTFAHRLSSLEYLFHSRFPWAVVATWSILWFLILRLINNLF